MNQHKFSDEEVILHKDVKFSTTAFIHAFCDVNKPRIKFSASISSFDVVADVIRGKFRNFGVNFIPAKIVIFDIAGKNGCVTVVRIAWAALCCRCTSNDGFHFDVFHGLRFHVPVGTRVHQHLWFRDLFAIIRMVLPFVAVVVAAPFISVLCRKVGVHIPKRGLVVVQMVVEVNKTGIDGPVGFNHRNIGQLYVTGDLVSPNSLDEAILNQNVSFVDDRCFSSHWHNTALQDICAFVDVVAEAVAADHVLCDGVGVTSTPAWRRRIHFGDGSVFCLHVRRVPPRIFTGIGDAVHELTRGVRNGSRVSVPIIQLNTGTVSEDNDVSSCFDRSIPSQTAGCGTRSSGIIKQPI